jgi:hypothetical protein
VIQIEVEEEFITNKLMKRLEALKKEKQVSAPSPLSHGVLVTLLPQWACKDLESPTDAQGEGGPGSLSQ